MATRWQPDTCGCVIDFDGVNEDGTLINPVAVKTCMKHADQKGETLATSVLAHNGKKNMVLNALLEAGASIKTVSVTYDKDDNFVVSGAPEEAIAAVIADEKVPVIEVKGDVESAALGESAVVLTKG